MARPGFVAYLFVVQCTTAVLCRCFYIRFVLPLIGETICKQNGVKYRAATEDTTFSTDYYFAESYLVLIPVDNNGKMSAPVTSELLTTSAK